MDGNALGAPLLANEVPTSPFVISVKTLAGKSIILDNLQPGDTIASLKLKIFDSLGCPIAEQTLIHAGRKLEDGSALASFYHLTSGAIVYLVLGGPASGFTSSSASAAPASATPGSASPTGSASPSEEPQRCSDEIQDHAPKNEPLPTELPRPAPPSPPAVSPTRTRWASRYDFTRSGQHGRACLHFTDLLLSGSAEQRAAVKRPQSFTLEQLVALDLADPDEREEESAAEATTAPRFSEHDLAKLRQERQERQRRLALADAALKQAAHDRAEASKELDAIDRELRRAIAFCSREPKVTSGAMPPASAIAAWLSLPIDL